MNSLEVYIFSMGSTLTVKFKGAEVDLLDRLVRSGLFATKSEAVRAALVKYGTDLGLLRAGDLWAEIDRTPRRRVTDRALLDRVKKVDGERRGKR